MSEVEITHDEVRGIDINQVASMQLKDGTVVVVNSESTAEIGDYQEDQGEFAQEELAQDENVQQVEENVEQSNQLRARPMVGMPYGVRPVVPVRPAVIPGRPMVVPKPIPRGPVVRPGMPMGGVVFRGRPGMPVHMPPPRPGVPIMRPGYPSPMMPKPSPMRPVVVSRPMGVAPKPMGVAPKPLVNQIITAPRFRARPNINEEEDFQQEYAGEEDYCECEDYQENEEENQLRARPLVVPAPMTYGPKVVRPPVHHVPHHPPVVVPQPRVVPVPVKRGPVIKPGYTTYQPGVFRGRRMVHRPVAVPMFTPVAPAYGVHRMGRPMPPPPRPYGFGMGPVFRNRPNTTEYDETQEDYAAEECDNNTCVCTKCGKEF